EALGTEYVVVHGPKSREYYRDFQRPERAAAVLPAVYHIEDDTIYALPPPARVPVNFDPGWRATQNGLPVPIVADRLGFIAAPQGAELRYAGTAEQRIMAAISAVAWIAALARLRTRRSSD